MAESSAVDFTPLRVRPWEGIMDPIAASFQHAMDQKAKREEQERQLAFQREQEARRSAEDKARQATVDRRLLGQQTLQTAQERAKADSAIRQAAGVPGNLNEAKRLAQSYVELDPETNTVIHGRPFSVQDAGPAPVAPAAPAPAEEGPRIGQDDLENAAVIRAQQEGPPPTTDEAGGMQVNAGGTLDKYNEMKGEAARFGRTQDDAAQYEKDQGAFGLQQANYQERVRNPKVNIGGVETTPDEIRYTGARAGAEDFKGMSAPLQQGLRQAMETGDPQTIHQAQRKVQVFAELLPQVERGLITPAQASARIGSAGTIEETLAGKLGGQREHDATVGQTARDVAKINAGRPRSAGSPTAQEGVDIKALSAANADLEHFQKNWNISGDRQEEMRMGSLLKSSDKSIVQRAIASNLSRGLAGEKGVLTDQDVNRLQKNLGGAWVEVQNWLDKGATGQLDPTVLAKLKEGISVVLSEKQQKRAQASKAYDNHFMSPTSPYQKMGLGNHLKNVRAEIFGDGADSGTVGSPGGKKSIQDLIREAGGQ